MKPQEGHTPEEIEYISKEWDRTITGKTVKVDWEEKPAFMNLEIITTREGSKLFATIYDEKAKPLFEKVFDIVNEGPE
jgi:nicotinamide riboside kinase